VDRRLLGSATGRRSEDFDLDQPINLGELARALPIDATTVSLGALSCLSDSPSLEG
jgi:hypothetical protein